MKASNMKKQATPKKTEQHNHTYRDEVRHALALTSTLNGRISIGTDNPDTCG
jgi:phage gp36-like protein